MIAGAGIRWPELDEDLTTPGLLAGAPARPGTRNASVGRCLRGSPRWGDRKVCPNSAASWVRAAMAAGPGGTALRASGADQVLSDGRGWRGSRVGGPGGAT